MENKISEQIIDQLVKKCVHFDGIMNKCCKAGVEYSSVMAGRLMFPCRQTGGSCSKAKYPTRKEAEAQELEMMTHAAQGLEMFAAALDHHEKTGSTQGTIKCPCGGTMNYAVASNGHIRAGCPSCGNSFLQ